MLAAKGSMVLPYSRDRLLVMQTPLISFYLFKAVALRLVLVYLLAVAGFHSSDAKRTAFTTRSASSCFSSCG